MTEEQFCLHQLRVIQEAWQAAAKPYVDRLVAIRSLEARPQILVNLDDLPPEALERLTQ